MTYSVQIPAPAAYINSNDRLHYHRRAELTRAWRGAAYVAFRKARLPRLAQARIVVTFAFASNHRRDVGNLHPTAKAIVDGLVDAEVLPDDDDLHMLGPDLRRARVGTGVRIDIEPISLPNDKERAS